MGSRSRKALLAALPLLVVLGCGHASDGTAPPAQTSPLSTSPAGAVERFAWALEHKDVVSIGRLLTNDVSWVRGGEDSTGRAVQTLHDRAWLLAAIGSMLDGVPGRHAPSDVSLLLDHDLSVHDDSRPGRDARFHKQVRTTIDLKVRDGDGMAAFEATGTALLFLTRGDSASIPPDLVARGMRPDSTTWWIDRFEDETIASGFAGVGKDPSLTRLLDFYYSRLTP